MLAKLPPHRKKHREFKNVPYCASHPPDSPSLRCPDSPPGGWARGLHWLSWCPQRSPALPPGGDLFLRPPSQTVRDLPSGAATPESRERRGEVWPEHDLEVFSLPCSAGEGRSLSGMGSQLGRDSQGDETTAGWPVHGSRSPESSVRPPPASAGRAKRKGVSVLLAQGFGRPFSFNLPKTEKLSVRHRLPGTPRLNGPIRVSAALASC